MPPYLLEHELFWKERYAFFESRGYKLRPRYHPDGVPCPGGPHGHPDHIQQIAHDALDAVRKDDGGTKVFIKKVDVRLHPNEVDIARYLSSPEARKDDRNHCVTVLEVFRDQMDEQVWFIVMPLLRPFNEPPFDTVDEVVHFVDQSIEGLVFMHEHHVAHRDCAAANIMMEGSVLCPSGWHPILPSVAPDYSGFVRFSSRADHFRDIRYYFIDFGLSSRFRPGESHLVVGSKCRGNAPEFNYDRPYDAFKLDIFLLGDVYKETFLEQFDDVQFLHPLIAQMTAPDPVDRPTARELLDIWTGIRSSLTTQQLRQRLRDRNETIGIRVWNDVLSTYHHAIRDMRGAFGSWSP
ncbi:hypothetical protein BS17DRAFT_696424 [Gyrodon lividus]|nr:hypothetical protein BS17DRAFT_696424 [Gyrodon lividus]